MLGRATCPGASGRPLQVWREAAWQARWRAEAACGAVGQPCPWKTCLQRGRTDPSSGREGDPRPDSPPAKQPGAGGWRGLAHLSPLRLSAKPKAVCAVPGVWWGLRCAWEPRRELYEGQRKPPLGHGEIRQGALQGKDGCLVSCSPHGQQEEKYCKVLPLNMGPQVACGCQLWERKVLQLPLLPVPRLEPH